jgi:hypothetical protein
VEGAWYVGGVHVNDSYMRLTRVIDLGGVTAAQQPQLRAQLSFDTEEGYDNRIVEAEGFETGLGPWTVPGPPPGSPPGGGDFRRSQAMLSPAVTTADTVLFGFGVEQVGSAAERTALLGRSLEVVVGEEAPT